MSPSHTDVFLICKGFHTDGLESPPPPSPEYFQIVEPMATSNKAHDLALMYHTRSYKREMPSGSLEKNIPGPSAGPSLPYSQVTLFNTG